MAADGFERTEIDGVPTFVADGPERCSALLMFRVGRADETLVESGISHLVEHLGLFGLGERTPYSYNGRVTGLTTEFGMTGTPAEAAEFLTHVTRALGDLPYTRVPDEARVLRTEAAATASGFLEDHLWLRFGATGHGLRRMPELAHLVPDPERVRAWAARSFTAGNAALVLSESALSGVRLTLPSGSRQPGPTVKGIPDVAFPTWFRGGGGAVSLSCAVPRRDWLSLGFDIAAARLRQDLRYERGLTYDVRGMYEPLDAERGHVTLWATCLPENAETVRDGVVASLREVARKGATPEEMNRVVEGHRRQRIDPDAGWNSACYAAFNELLGSPQQTWDEMQAEIEALDGAEIGRRLTSAMKTALLIQPPECAEPIAFKSYPVWSEESVEGETFRHATVRFPWSKGPRLTVGERGVTLRSPPGGDITIFFEACAAAVVTPDGSVDLFGEDGFRIGVQAGQWVGSMRAIRAILDHLPQERVVKLPGPR